MIQYSTGAGWIILDIVPGLLLGFIPILVDAITGAWSYADPEMVNIILTPVAPGE